MFKQFLVILVPDTKLPTYLLTYLVDRGRVAYGETLFFCRVYKCYPYLLIYVFPYCGEFNVLVDDLVLAVELR